MKTVLNEAKKRIDLYDDNACHLGEIEYMHGGGGNLYATHTEVFAGNEGRGYAKVLLQALVDFARERNTKIVPVCPFVKAEFAKHPEKYACVIKEKA